MFKVSAYSASGTRPSSLLHRDIPLRPIAVITTMGLCTSVWVVIAYYALFSG